jgi:hypothetical protein
LLILNDGRILLTSQIKTIDAIKLERTPVITPVTTVDDSDTACMSEAEWGSVENTNLFVSTKKSQLCKAG